MAGLNDNAEFIQEFLVESTENLDQLDRDLIALEQAPADEDRLASIFRTVHTIKGNSGFFGFSKLGALTHSGEHLLGKLRDGKLSLDDRVTGSLYSMVDAVRSILQSIEATGGEGEQDFRELAQTLTAVAAGEGAPVAAKPKSPPSEPATQPQNTAPTPSPAPVPPPAEAAPAVPAVAEKSLDQPAAGRSASESSIRVDVGLVASILDLVGELVLARNQLRSIETLDPGMQAVVQRINAVTNALQETAVKTRLQPIEQVFSKFPRTVRDLAVACGKEVQLVIDGADTELDRTLIESIRDPLTHLVRNAVDHGIELPEVRRAAGKPEQARIVVEARHHAGQLQVRVVDDGRGIDPDAIRRKVVERGMQAAEVAARLGERELFDFLFLPGFSTAKQVTEISGRGVGLDVVHQMVTSTSGTVRVESRVGAGTTFSMQLPVTLSVVRAALVQVGGEPYAFPLARIDRVLRVGTDAITAVQGRLQCEVDGESTGLVDGAALLGVGETVRGAATSVVVLGDDHGKVGLVVERFLGEQDLVVRTLDPRLGKIPHVAAAAILDDGSPALIIDVEDTLATLRKQLGDGSLSGIGTAEASEGPRRATKRILIAEDSITVREVERQLLLRLGYDVAVAVDGMDAWNQLRAGRFDMLVTDIDMPRMNGIELVRLVRADGRFAHLPIAVVSYKDREEDRRAGLDAGANAYLTKGSFHDQSFTATVTELVGAP